VDVDDDFVVAHVQDVSVLRALTMHFHNGRVHGGRLTAEPASVRRTAIRNAWRMPATLERDVHQALRWRPSMPYPVRDRIATWMVGCAHMLGFVVGIGKGAGSSARQVT
jgi:hypothetical protein